MKEKKEKEDNKNK